MMSNSEFIYDQNTIVSMLPDEPPYIFIDYAHIKPDNTATGYRDFPETEWFFPIHFPSDPCVPAVFMCEAIMQLAVIIAKINNNPDEIFYLKKITLLDCVNKVFPNERLFIEVSEFKIKRGIVNASGRTYVIRDGKEVHTSTATFQIINPSIMSAFTPKTKKG